MRIATHLGLVTLLAAGSSHAGPKTVPVKPPAAADAVPPVGDVPTFPVIEPTHAVAALSGRSALADLAGLTAEALLRPAVVSVNNPVSGSASFQAWRVAFTDPHNDLVNFDTEITWGAVKLSFDVEAGATYVIQCVGTVGDWVMVGEVTTGRRPEDVLTSTRRSHWSKDRPWIVMHPEHSATGVVLVLPQPVHVGAKASLGACQIARTAYARPK